jgi:hypothetical protein
MLLTLGPRSHSVLAFLVAEALLLEPLFELLQRPSALASPAARRLASASLRQRIATKPVMQKASKTSKSSVTLLPKWTAKWEKRPSKMPRAYVHEDTSARTHGMEQPFAARENLVLP